MICLKSQLSSIICINHGLSMFFSSRDSKDEVLEHGK